MCLGGQQLPGRAVQFVQPPGLLDAVECCRRVGDQQLREFQVVLVEERRLRADPLEDAPVAQWDGQPRPELLECRIGVRVRVGVVDDARLPTHVDIAGHAVVGRDRPGADVHRRFFRDGRDFEIPLDRDLDCTPVESQDVDRRVDCESVDILDRRRCLHCGCDLV